MGSVCCCLHVEPPEENTNGSTHGVCKCPGCLIKTFFTKIVKSRRDERNSNGAAILQPNIAPPNNALNETFITRSITLPVNPNQSVAYQLHKSTEQQIRSREVQAEQKPDDHNSETLNSPSQERLLEARDSYINTSADDENVCPTCLEEYDSENPKIVTECNHNFHLACIYEWMERSETCPICSKVMVF